MRTTIFVGGLDILRVMAFQKHNLFAEIGNTFSRLFDVLLQFSLFVPERGNEFFQKKFLPVEIVQQFKCSAFSLLALLDAFVVHIYFFSNPGQFFLFLFKFVFGTGSEGGRREHSQTQKNNYEQWFKHGQDFSENGPDIFLLYHWVM